MKSTRFITAHDLLLVKSWAKDFLIELANGSKLDGIVEPLTEGDRLALAYVYGVLNLIGEDTIHVKIKVHPPEGHDPL